MPQPSLNVLPSAPPAVALAPAPEPGGPPSLWGLLPAELRAMGYPQDAQALFRRVQRVSSWRDGGVDVGKAGRALLSACDQALPAIVERHPSADGSTRCVLRTVDGHRFEAVHMPRAVRVPRTTLCISSQIGCAMGCTFCATASMGVVRNLSAGEVVGQVLALMHALGPSTGHALNLVFMGMGEPLHNFDHVARAVEVLCHKDGVGMSPNRITVSTSGLLPGIERLARLPAAVRPLLAVSVNATTDDVRSRIMPVNRAFPLAALKRALLAYPLRRGEKILLEYVLLRGDNDTDDDAARLAELARGLPHNINVIPLNEHAHTSHQAPDDAWVERFARKVSELGCLCIVRNTRGRDVRGACGMLVTSSSPPASPS